MKGKSNKIKIFDFFKIVGIVVNLLFIILMIASAYSGYVNPLEDAKFAVLGMCFPIFLILVITCLFLWICFKQWKAVLTNVVSLVICTGPILTLSPINIFSPEFSNEEKAKSFTLLSYNIMNFDDYEDGKSDENNRTLQYIIDTDADFVCLQECDSLAPSKYFKVTASQMKKLLAKYKYHTVGGRDVAFLSKTPIEASDIKAPKIDGCGFDIYKITVHGEPMTIVNVHLESIGLTLVDKELYMGITSLNKKDGDIKALKEDVKAVRYKLLSKLAAAFRERARQAQAIRRFLSKIDGTIILCGDFNDTPNSYSYRLIKGDMDDAYVECGFGPTITYHANRFYFKIDQVFYKGDIVAKKIVRGKNPSSDHYPLLTTFVVDDTKK